MANNWLPYTQFLTESNQLDRLERILLEDGPYTTIKRNHPVHYNDASHTYTFSNERYISATQLVHKFIPVFNTKERTAHMADRYGGDPVYWESKWDDNRDMSCVRGNKLHDREEQFLYGTGFTSVNNKPYIVHKIPSRLKQHVDYYYLPDGTYPEMLLWRHDCKLAGRADKPTLDTLLGKRYSFVEDYKTNKKIDREGWKVNGATRMMLEPLSHLIDCNFTHYALQLSIYQFMLEYFGFVPAGQRIIHYPHRIEGIDKEPLPVPYDLPYLREEVISMLNYK